MDARFYNTTNLDVERLATDLRTSCALRAIPSSILAITSK